MRIPAQDFLNFQKIHLQIQIFRTVSDQARLAATEYCILIEKREALSSSSVAFSSKHEIAPRLSA